MKQPITFQMMEINGNKHFFKFSKYNCVLMHPVRLQRDVSLYDDSSQNAYHSASNAGDLKGGIHMMLNAAFLELVKCATIGPPKKNDTSISYSHIVGPFQYRL